MKQAFQTTTVQLTAPIPHPLHFAFVSDLHNIPNEPILSALRAQKLDAILGGGDLIHNERIYARGFEFLRAAAGIAPVFCCIGNHELRYAAPNDLVRDFAQAGATLLNNSDILFEGIQIGGLTSGHLPSLRTQAGFRTPPPETAWLERFCKSDRYRMVLSHHPEYYEPYLRDLPIDLILSGHAHGGQWRFFGRGVYAPGQGLFPRYTSGVFDQRLIVGRGLGNPHRIPRLFNRPELILLHLLPKS